MKLAIRIAGKIKNKKKDEETLKRLKLEKKYSARIIDEKDAVRIGMIESVAHMTTYGNITEEFKKELEKKRPAKNDVHFLHPPIGGLKKSSKVAAPKGILGHNKEIEALARRML